MLLDFYSDWVSILRQRLRTAGYQISDGLSEEGVATAYLNLLHRQIERKQRRVHRASSLAVPECLVDAVASLEAKARQGRDLVPHLSRKLLDPLFNDNLLNDWGIHHFHLGPASNKTFVERSDKLLFAHVTASDLYVIHVGDHDSWDDPLFLETILVEWPEVLGPYEMKGLLPPAPDKRWRGREIRSLRQAGVVPLIALSNGKAYAPLGGGCTLSGISTRVMLRLTAARRTLREWERIARQTIACDGRVNLVIRAGLAYAQDANGARHLLGRIWL